MKFHRKRQKPSPSPTQQPSPQHTTTRPFQEDHDQIYDYYIKELIPALLSSLPILMHRVFLDSKAYIYLVVGNAYHFLLPGWQFQYINDPSSSSSNNDKSGGFHHQVALKLAQLWERTPQPEVAFNNFLLQHFDANRDGQLSASEFVNLTEIITKLQSREMHTEKVQTFWVWLSREWPLLDWKLGVLLWRSFGGILLILAVLSIVPGRLHSLSGKILRWPILLMTYLIIAVELLVYIWIRLGIRLAETLIASPTHRQLRRKMAQAESYPDWYQHAAALDLSQKRDKWQKHNDEATGYIYNWQLIKQLIADLQDARRRKDSLLALAVLRQCTRKNVGGVMSEDLFSYTNTGEPKYIVSEFIDEVTTTLDWITDDALGGLLSEIQRSSSNLSSSSSVSKYDQQLSQKTRDERDKIWKSIVNWATLNFDPKEKDAQSYCSTDDSHDRNVGPDEPKPNPSRTKRHHHLHQLREFLKAARAAYGRTALCLAINTDKYTIHKRSSFVLGPSNSTEGNKNGYLEWYMPIKRQIRYNPTGNKPEGKNMYMVWWFSTSDGGTPANSVRLQYSLKKYWREPQSS